MDESQIDKTIKSQITAFKTKYKSKENLIICESNPSIEFWFLLHFEKTTASTTSKEIEEKLKNYIDQYAKKKVF